ncbi:hypothetical protein [Pseudomonas lopnurensis]|uniref:hypothetical protein n=1 Tax=Pseudomonas lopnurensis TaxID=1477517 RepID=UPI0028A5D9DD|nr:hypothetical protein [Pseudomonas lopnurensis]
MTNYTVRVVLIDAEWDDYEQLHEAMGRKGFTRTIADGDGKVYQLPDAEYNLPRSNLDRQAVLKQVKSAAGTTGKRYSVLVTQSAGRTWYNLEEA